jgi:hypothetical protein
MTQVIGIPFGVCVLPAPPRNAGRTAQYADYIHEILAHAGLCYERVDANALIERLPTLRLLVTVGNDAPLESQRQALAQWIRDGGAWLSLAGVCGQEEALGVILEQPAIASWGGGVCSLGEGYLHPAVNHPALADAPVPLHFYGGIAVRANGATVLAHASNAHQQPTPRAALTEHRYGQGSAMLIAPDLTGAVVRIQQGVAVTRDGVSASDGTAPVADGVLKSDDGAVLDWIFDRQETPGAPGYRAFLEPIADGWRALLLRAIFSLAQRQGIALPLLWLYPRNLPALAHLSHDTDGNAPAEAQRLLEVLAETGIRSTWCVILPGYAPDLKAAIQDAGHELAMHYDAMSDGLDWGRSEFTRQWTELTALFSGHAPVSNKNHYLRWEGDTEFFRWCEDHGIELDQTKGASKTGEAGFNFGTCHPYFPVAPDGAPHNVLELCTPTQDLETFAPIALLSPLLDAVLRHHGVLHLLFHPAHIHKPGVAEAIRMAAAQAAQHGMEFWTAERLNGWERARRTLAWERWSTSQRNVDLTCSASVSLPEATLLWLGTAPNHATVNGRELPLQTVERWGCTFQAVTFDLNADTTYTLRIETAPIATALIESIPQQEGKR